MRRISYFWIASIAVQLVLFADAVVRNNAVGIIAGWAGTLFLGLLADRSTAERQP